MKTIMITAPGSNTGKTTITLGLIRALKNRGIDVRGFKTGPDFIDTKLLSKASRKASGNLDLHMMGDEGIEEAISMNLGGVGVVEGAMGYFDGIFNTYENSSFDISRKLDIPAVLVYSPKGEMFSAIPKIKGMVDFKDSKIKALILNKTSKSMYLLLKEQIEEYIGIKVLGYLPNDETLKIESESLGLSINSDREKLDSFLDKIAVKIEETVNLDGFLDLANDFKIEKFKYPRKRNIKIAIAYDKAFNFYYQENLNLFQKICSVEYFSPLEDKAVPKADLIYIGGGYPENYKEELSLNKDMMNNLRELAIKGSYILAESGGLIYLEESLEGRAMVNIFKGRAKLTNKLKRFGYVNIELLEDTLLGEKGDIISGKEFHKSFIETDEEEIFSIKKPMSSKSWRCGYKFKNTLGYFQHINFLGNKYAFENLLDKLEKIRSDIDVY
ncbi:MAG: cobyrinate a,c-diamide synthase [Tissierella sp.]|uniref:cobyrinate a,c-diamide synthase n=1 Tax=Tissierella sp. TaxID=41274 RepID=UPI003F992D2B